MIAYISGNTATVWGMLKNSNILELHFPLELKNTEGYTIEDLSTFSVDDTLFVQDNIMLKLGNYSVTETENELVVDVELLTID